jgi:hypothetical protein
MNSINNNTEKLQSIREILTEWALELQTLGYSKLSNKVFDIINRNDKLNSVSITISDNDHDAWNCGFVKYLTDNFNCVNSNYGLTAYIKL